MPRGFYVPLTLSQRRLLERMAVEDGRDVQTEACTLIRAGISAWVQEHLSHLDSTFADEESQEVTAGGRSRG
jgi:hypothetical protein